MANKICQECYWHEFGSTEKKACCVRFAPTTICDFEDGEPLDLPFPEVDSLGQQCGFADQV
jgi:hypothetical protein